MRGPQHRRHGHEGFCSHTYGHRHAAGPEGLDGGVDGCRRPDELGGDVHAPVGEQLHFTTHRGVLPDEDRLVGAEGTSPIEGRRISIDRNDRSRADQLGNLDGERSEAADSDDGGGIALPEAGLAGHGVIRGRPGVGCYRSGLGGQSRRSGDEAASVHDHGVGPAPVDVDPDEHQLLAQVGPAVETRPARAARQSGGHDDEIALVPVRVAGQRHHTGDLVAESHRHRAGPGRAVEEVEVGSTHAAGHDIDPHLAATRWDRLDLLESEVADTVETEGVSRHGPRLRSRRRAKAVRPPHPAPPPPRPPRPG